MELAETKHILAKVPAWAWIAVMLPLAVTGKEPFPTKELTNIVVKHHVPMPPPTAQLVLAHTESWQVIGNESTSRDPAIYSPAFLLKENADGSITILRGTEEQVLERNHPDELLWRPFSDQVVKPKLGGYMSDLNRRSAFVCAVQLAARGDEGTAQRIWQKLDGSDRFSDGEPFEDVAGELKNPTLLLGECMFVHLKNRVLSQPQQWPEIYDRMKPLFEDFPVMKTDERQKAVFDGLHAALNAKAPAPNSTEALLISWSREPRGRRSNDQFLRADGGIAPLGRSFSVGRTQFQT